MKFKISEKLVKERDGKNYDLSKYVEGTDYVLRKAFKGVKRVFREDILEASSLSCNLSADHVVDGTDMIAVTVVDPSLVEHKQDMEPIVITKPANLDGAVRATRVVKKHMNQRYVETDTLGRVFVGSKGNQVKVNQIINVLNGNLFLGNLPNPV